MPGGHISSIILKLAAPCNLNCSYCYVYNHEDSSFLLRPKFLTDEIFDATLSAMREYCARRDRHTMSITFHGGEPTLIGAENFARLAARARKRLGHRLAGMTIQTNATLLDDRWVEVFRRYDVQVGISLDGPKEVNDAVRVDHAGRGTHARTLAGLRRAQDAGLQPSVLCVVNPGHSGIDIYRYFLSLGVTRMDFLLPDVSHDNKPRLYGRFDATPVADYLIPIFDSWFGDDDPEIKVRLFWGLLRLLMGGKSETDCFSNPLMGYLVVETDGSIEALDALRVCEEGLGRSNLNVLRNGFDDLHLGLPVVYQLVHQGVPLSPACQACSERDVCGGGYLPHRYSRANGFDNPSVWCADILKLLAHIRHRVAEVEA
jgi:uncharacterized protein